MANIINVVIQREGKGVECQMCGRAWTPKNMAKLPKRCRYEDCRSMRWDATKYPNAGPPRPPRPSPCTPDDGRNIGEQRANYRTPEVTAAQRKPSLPVSHEDRSLAHAAVA